MSKGAQIPPAVEEDPVLVVSSGSTVSAAAQVASAVAVAPAQLPVMGDCLSVRFAVPRGCFVHPGVGGGGR